MKIIIQETLGEDCIEGIRRDGLTNNLIINIGSKFIDNLMKGKKIEFVIPDKLFCDYLRERGVKIK